MTRGRKPKPTAQKILEGNPGKRPLNKDEPKPDAAPEAGAPPKYLSPRAKAEWRRLYEPLRRCGLLTVADLSAFGAYCASYGRYEEAEEIANKGMLTTTPNKHKQAHPCVAISRQERLMMKAFMVEFGLTPASRSRIASAGTPPPPSRGAEDEEDQQPIDPAPAGEFAGLIGKGGRRPN